MNNETLGAILAAHGLPPAGNISRPSDGRNNPIFIVDDAYVVRFDGLPDEADPEFTTRFRAEAWVYETLFAAGLPVPRVLAVDESRTLAAVPYMLMTKLEGRSAIESHDLTPQQRRTVASEYGAFLARMHDAVRFDRFGKWHQLEHATHHTRWSQWPFAFFDYYANWSDELGGAADAALVRDFRQLLEDTRPYFDAVSHGVIAHRDAHPGNVLQENGALTGLIDFEWWMAADPATDFAVIDQWEAYGAGCESAIYEAYTASRPLTAGHQQKVRVYNLLRHFDDVVTYFSIGNIDQSRAAANIVRAGLNSA